MEANMISPRQSRDLQLLEKIRGHHCFADVRSSIEFDRDEFSGWADGQGTDGDESEQARVRTLLLELLGEVSL